MSETVSSDEDFSASSEDWNPNDSDNDSEEEIFEATTKTRQSLPKSRKAPQKSCITVNKKQVQRKKDANSDSESSVEDYLVHPDSLNFKSSFFDNDHVPSFDQIQQSILEGAEVLKEDEACNSDDVPDNDRFEENSLPSEADHSKSNELNEKRLNFQQIHDFSKNLQNVTLSMQNYKNDKKSEENNLNIEQLLALGEKSKPIETKHVIDSESDEFEEVKTSGTNAKNLSKEGLTITINFPKSHKTSATDADTRKQKILRKLNNIKKQNQIYIHKVHVLCWIAHGNYVNRILNYPKLMKAAVGLIPSDNCYPPKQSDLKYLEMILKWFVIKMKFVDMNKKKNKKVDMSHISKLNLQDNMTLVQSLSAQLKTATAHSKRSLTLIFVVLMRALGLQCRMILSFVTLPLKPPASELYNVTTKTNQKASVDTNMKSKKLTKRHSVSALKQKSASISSSKSKSSDLQKDVDTSMKAKSKIESKKRDDVKIEAQQGRTTKAKNIDERAKSYKSPIITSASPQSKTKNNELVTTPKQEVKEINKKQLSRESKSNIIKKKSVSPFSPAVTRNKAKINSELLKKASNLKISQMDGTDDSPMKKKLNLKNIRSIDVKKQKVVRSDEKKETIQSNLKNIRSIDVQKQKVVCYNEKNIHRPSSSKDNTEKSKCKAKKIKLSKTSKSLKCTNDSSETEGRHGSKRKLTREVDSESEYFRPSKRLIDKIDPIDRRVLSTDDEEVENGRTCDIWAEVFLEAEEKWISVDVVNCKIHCVKELYNKATHPVTYIVAWNNDLSIKDVTRRYVPKWNTVTRKLRVESDWWESTLKPWLGRKTLRDRQEDEDLYRSQLEQPLPTSIQEFKNHPLYVLGRHILKFQAIYPPDAMTLGFIRGEPVFARECVHTLHSRDMWLKEAKVVRLGEKPYKIVKARPKYDKLTNSVINDIQLELFGSWQIEDYVPPTAENGIVPRNAYGNVELFKPSMIPKGTVHLQLPGLNKVARKLQIDCAPAVVGFDFHSGFTHPVYDGFIVCEEHKEILVAAWYQEEEEAEKRAIDRIEKRVYGNWKKLIKGLIIREQLKARYNFGESPDENKNVKGGKTKADKVKMKKY